MARIVNKRELSETIDVSERSLTEWQKEGMPMMAPAEGRGQENQYDVAAVVQWMIGRALAKAQSASPRDDLDRVRAQRERLALEKDLGNVVEKKEVRPALERYVLDVVGVIEAMPEKYAGLLQQAPELDAKHQLLQEMMREIRTALGSYEFSSPTDNGDNARLSSAA